LFDVILKQGLLGENDRGAQGHTEREGWESVVNERVRMKGRSGGTADKELRDVKVRMKWGAVTKGLREWNGRRGERKRDKKPKGERKRV
jgi:hypothetical protein